ncbi:MAG: c-type cytochrome, partial [Planctomycetia bacterium]
MVFALGTIGLAASSSAAEPPFDAAAARGKAALEGRSHIMSIWKTTAYQDLPKAWKGSGAKHADEFRAAAFRRYGLHPAPFPNDDLPLGLRYVSAVERRDGATNSADRCGLTIDCMLCHGGAVFGESRVGQPNVTLDLALLGRDLLAASGRYPTPSPFPPNRLTGVTNAGAMGVFLIAFRNEDFSKRLLPLDLRWLDLPDIDAPAWWLLKKKKTMYWDGGMAADSTRSMMQFLLGFDKTEADMAAAEPTWDDVRQYILSIEPPKYPFPIDAPLAQRGEALFRTNCAECHGTYGATPSYPNRIIGIDEIGTDRARLDGISEPARLHYNKTWYGHLHPATKGEGYQAPPLDGVWATAPYFHNGAVPTLFHVLNSSTRPTKYWRIERTDEDLYDQTRVGWKVEPAEGVKAKKLDDAKRRRLFDAADFGRGVGGHTFGDHFTDAERYALIEYLKTL